MCMDLDECKISSFMPEKGMLLVRDTTGKEAGVWVHKNSLHTLWKVVALFERLPGSRAQLPSAGHSGSLGSRD